MKENKIKRKGDRKERNGKITSRRKKEIADKRKKKQTKLRKKKRKSIKDGRSV